MRAVPALSDPVSSQRKEGMRRTSNGIGRSAVRSHSVHHGPAGSGSGPRGEAQVTIREHQGSPTTVRLSEGHWLWGTRSATTANQVEWRVEA